MLEYLGHRVTTSTLPTIGFNVETIEHENIKFTVLFIFKLMEDVGYGRTA